MYFFRNQTRWLRVSFLLALSTAGARLAMPAAANRAMAHLLLPSNRTGNVNLFLIRQDGEEPRNLTDSSASDLFPAWSPDGKRIAFVSDRTGSLQIYVMTADGKDLMQLTSSKGSNRGPAWSPDGKRIAFTSDRDGNNEIYVMDADGARQTNLTANPAYDADPCWSPDGKHLAFASTRSGPQGFRLHVMDADGKNVKSISTVNNVFGLVYPAWSPDGQKIVYADAAAAGGHELFECSPDGSRRKQLTHLGGTNGGPAWSPDGTTIAFLHAPQGQPAASLYLMDGAGRHPHEVLSEEAPLEGGRPAWKPR